MTATDRVKRREEQLEKSELLISRELALIERDALRLHGEIGAQTIVFVNLDSGNVQYATVTDAIIVGRLRNVYRRNNVLIEIIEGKTFKRCDYENQKS
jgi:hypothetical protein